MLKRISFVAALAVFLSLSFAGPFSCAGSGSGGTPDAGDPDLACPATPTPTTFTKVYADVFPDCNTCHIPGAPDMSDSYGLYDTADNAFKQVSKPSLYKGTTTLKVVDPKHPENSSMWLKVLGHPKSPAGQTVGGKMPLGGAGLNAPKMAELKDWICSGALR